MAMKIEDPFPERADRRSSAVCMAARSGSAPYFFGLAAVGGRIFRVGVGLGGDSAGDG
ncbi:MAG: hypothetical protein M1548_06670 [Actinobacteria bacterium]|nr:hypothetical protein [Actinomycetota bacterium]